MQFTDFSKLDLARLPSPCFVVDEVAIEKNLKLLKYVADESGAQVLAALKAFSMWSLAPIISKYLSGTCVSGLNEARLAQQYFPGQIHVFSPAYSETDLSQLLKIGHHIVFNSCPQWQRQQPLIQQAKLLRPELRFGLRINPEHSEGAVPIYDPCAPGSRLGIPLSQLQESSLEGISGLHFHSLCEQGFAALNRTLEVVEQKFGHLLHSMEWMNFGGGHHITAPDYDVMSLIDRLKRFAQTHQLQIYLEPGEAIAIGTGILTTEILDLTWNQMNQAILNISATCHMPDTLEMPYRPDIKCAVAPGEDTYAYRMGGLSCLAGDVIGDYHFKQKLQLGQRLIFEDMSHYTMVKTTTFNGTQLPAIAIWNSETDDLKIVREFTYEDFRNRLS